MYCVVKAIHHAPALALIKIFMNKSIKYHNNVQPGNKISIMICEIVCYIVLNIKKIANL